ncbi:MAG: sigma 54-interacting transcriptional regulator [Polyangiaceae bacterium]
MPSAADLTMTVGKDRVREALRELVVPHVVVALECDRPTSLPVRISLADVSAMDIGRGKSRHVTKADGRFRVDVPDRCMSSKHATLKRDTRTKPEGVWVLEDTGSKNGVLVNGKRVNRAELVPGDLFELGHTMFLFLHREARVGDDPEVFDVATSALPAGFRTLVPELARQFEDVQKLAASKVPLLLLGETGTGKEMVARGIHALSGRTGDFVAVNCGALPANLVESELFGSKKGAFSGATEDRPGLVRASDKGTLLLDEVGDLPLTPQAALLRTLQESEVTPVGASKPVPVDLRVLAATHHDVDALVAKKAFRSDLHARLNGFVVHLLPLRERPEDMGLLVAMLLLRADPKDIERLSFDPDAVRRFFQYGWPQNVRELEKCLRSAVVLAGAGSRVEIAHLPEPLRKLPKDFARPKSVQKDGAPKDDDVHVRLLAELATHKGNVSAVARSMGKARMQIHRWIRQYDVDLDRYRE